MSGRPRRPSAFTDIGAPGPSAIVANAEGPASARTVEKRSLYTDVAEGSRPTESTYQTPSLHYPAEPLRSAGPRRVRSGRRDTPLVVEVPHTYGDAGHGYIGRIESRGGTGTFWRGVGSPETRWSEIYCHPLYASGGPEDGFDGGSGCDFYPFFALGVRYRNVPSLTSARLHFTRFSRRSTVASAISTLRTVSTPESVDHGKHRHAEIEVFYLQVPGFDQERCGGGRVSTEADFSFHTFM